jgi:phosphatidylglycerol:prolipoprotein diacylglycerol transferase
LVGLSFNLYGLILGIALVSVLDSFQRKLDESEKRFLAPAMPWLLLAIIIGARMWHVVTDFYLYKENLVAILYIWNGGLSIFGALLGLFISIYIYTWISKPGLLKSELLNILDKLALYLPLGQFIGRIGNFINHELFGPPTNLPWGMFVPSQFRSEQFKDFEFFHPAFLYEMMGTGILFLLFKFLPFFNKSSRNGVIFYSYLLGYGIIRFVVDFFRLDYDALWILSVGQMVCLLMILFGLYKLRLICHSCKGGNLVVNHSKID